MESENKNLLLNIEDIEVIKSRNTRIRKCTPYDDKKSFDDMVLDAHIISKGCNVPYHRGLKNFPKCHKKEDVKSLLLSLLALCVGVLALCLVHLFSESVSLQGADLRGVCLSLSQSLL